VVALLLLVACAKSEVQKTQAALATAKSERVKTVNEYTTQLKLVRQAMEKVESEFAKEQPDDGKVVQLGLQMAKEMLDLSLAREKFPTADDTQVNAGGDVARAARTAKSITKQEKDKLLLESATVLRDQILENSKLESEDQALMDRAAPLEDKYN